MAPKKDNDKRQKINISKNVKDKISEISNILGLSEKKIVDKVLFYILDNEINLNKVFPVYQDLINENKLSR